MFTLLSMCICDRCVCVCVCVCPAAMSGEH